MYLYSNPKTGHRVRLAAACLTVVAAAVCGMTVAPADAATVVASTAPPISVAHAPSSDSASYWTTARMKSATSVDIAVKAPPAAKTSAAGTTVSPRYASAPTSAPAGAKAKAVAAGVTVPISTGRLFFNVPGDNYNHFCTASTLNSAKKNLLITAAHCLYTQGKGWHTNVTFVPAYSNGQRPYGTWSWSTAKVFTSWTQGLDYPHDQAFVALKPLNGKNIVNVVGGNGLAYGGSAVQSWVRIWGWPGEAPYNGETAYYCQGPTTKSGTDAVRTNCDLTGGASGGPWFTSFTDANTGYVFAETSRRTNSGVISMLAAPNSVDTKSLYDQMG